MKTFKELSEVEPTNLLLVDSLNFAFRFRGKSAYKDSYISAIESFKRSFKCDKVILTSDEGKSSYRANIFPAYKGNREKLRENQSKEDKEIFKQFFNEFQNTISGISEYPVLKFKNTEADDIISYICKRYSGHYNIVILSSDRDLDLLVDENVSRFSYVTRKETRLDNWSEHYEYDPGDHISIKCLTGDSGDNIPGVPGIGPKKAQSLIKEYGSTYDIIASLPISSRYKHIANLNDFGADALLLNYKLMDLVSYCDEAIGEENCTAIDKSLESYL